MINEFLNQDKEMFMSDDRPVKLINMTPHPITFYDENNNTFTIETSGEVARTSKMPTVVDRLRVEANGMTFTIPVIETLHHVDHKRLPPEKKGVFYIVSGFFADAFPERQDLLVPNTAETLSNLSGVRDPETRKIIGIRAMRTNSKYRQTTR